jgi:predicted nucleic acid-binding protein
MKPKPCVSVQLWLADQDSICLSAISVEEVIFGLEAKQAVKKLYWFKRLLNESCEVLPVSGEIADCCGS